MQGDLRYFNPGQVVPVELVADSAGNVAERGDVVEIVGEEGGRTQVKLAEARGAGIGHIHRAPEGYDPDATYAAGEVVGAEGCAVYVDGPVDWFDTLDAYTATAGDRVVFDAGGVIDLYQPAAPVDGGKDDTPELIAGRVFATGTRATAATAGKAAVIRRV